MRVVYLFIVVCSYLRYTVMFTLVLAFTDAYGSRYALTAGRDKTVKLWNPYTGLCVKTYKGHGREVHDAAGSHDNSRVVSNVASVALSRSTIVVLRACLFVCVCVCVCVCV